MYDRTECRRDHRTGRTFEQAGRNRTSPTCYPYYGGNRRHRWPCKRCQQRGRAGKQIPRQYPRNRCNPARITLFHDDNIVHVDGRVDPVRDKEIIDAELQIKDLETIDSRIAKVQKQAQTGGDKQAKIAYEVLCKYKEALEQGKSARTVSFDTKDEQKIAHDLFLLTDKPVMYVCNVDEASAVNGNKYVEAVREAVKDEGAEILVVAAKIESEIAEFDTYEERQMFLQEIGLEESGVARLIKSAYKLLNLQTFLTAGPDECRAWTFHKGWKAPQCAGVIHTDFEKGFIRAEVIKYEDYISYGSESAVKEAGKMSVEGKEYIVQDGDIMHFRFNV